MTIWWRQNDVTAWRHQTLKWRFMTDLWRWRRRPSSFWRLNDDDDDARRHWKKMMASWRFSRYHSNAAPCLEPPIGTPNDIPKPNFKIYGFRMAFGFRAPTLECLSPDAFVLFHWISFYTQKISKLICKGTFMLEHASHEIRPRLVRTYLR